MSAQAARGPSSPVPLAAIFCGKREDASTMQLRFLISPFPNRAFHLAAAKGLLSDFGSSHLPEERAYISHKKAGANRIFSRIFLFLARGNNCASGAEEKATEVERGKIYGKGREEKQKLQIPKCGKYLAAGENGTHITFSPAT